MAEPSPHDVDPFGLQPWGIDPGYHDVFGAWHETSADTAIRLRRAMGATTDDPHERPTPETPLVVLRPHEVTSAPGPGPASLVLEDGTRLSIDTDTPPDLPLGYHRLEQETTHGLHLTNVIVSPGRAALAPDLRTWGVTAQLYAARSRASWGIGDLADLRRLIGWATDRGAGIVGLNPLHAPNPLPVQPNSPYSPSSRRWRDPIYLDIDQVPGAEHLPNRDALAARARGSNPMRIDRSTAWGAKRVALAHLWSLFGGAPAFDRYRAEHGEGLEMWATYCALVDHHGTGWRSWPSAHHRPDGPAVTRFAAEHTYEVSFWAWLQWLLDEQLAASGAAQAVVADLAVGFDANGADAWQWQDLIAHEARIGAPPDLLGPDGQDWGLPPFIPSKLRGAGYQPLATTIRSVTRHAAGLRIDHVMGLFRLFWVPPGRGAADGAYVRSHGRELLDVVALESARSGALVVGEDLGTVQDGVRSQLADAAILSTRLLWFEDQPPAAWPRQAMAAITTHDLPTVRGVWTGVDLADQRQAEVTIPDGGDGQLRHHLRVAASVDDAATADDVVLGAYRNLAEAPSMIVTASLDDLVGAEHRPNLPGTIDQHPNWRIPLPVPLDDLPGLPLAEAITEALRTGR